MEWNKIGLRFSLSRFKTYVNITTSADCYLVPGSIDPVRKCIHYTYVVHLKGRDLYKYGNLNVFFFIGGRIASMAPRILTLDPTM